MIKKTKTMDPLIYSQKEWDVVIVGAGPAGLFAANTLIEERDDINVLVIDRGRKVDRRYCGAMATGVCVQCPVCDIMCGEGGAGTFSDGTLNLRYDIGGNLLKFIETPEDAWKIIDEVDNIYLRFGAPKKLSNPSKSKKITELEHKAASVGARFINIPQRHIGSDKAPSVIRNITDDLKSKGVTFLFESEIEDLIVENGRCNGVTLKNEGGCRIISKFTLSCPGRVGIGWVEEMVEKHKIVANYGPIDVGVRVEVSAILMDEIISINRDPKFHIRTERYDDFVRTFCTNSHGFVVKEKYDEFVGVNGHAHKESGSDNTNFAFLVRVKLTEPLENTYQYGRSIAKLATTIGGGDPIVQRIGDLKKGRRTTPNRLKRNQVENTLKSVTPGDISMALPHRIVMDIIEGLGKLDEIIPGVMSDSTLLYGPEIKFYSMKVSVNRKMETSIEGLYAAGDGMGLSGDMVNASATGILAARGILNSMK
ncbi:MAG: NAD(P)/FAD-dependent oxidoreductase [Candidatus Thermoplasmatota archaeon]|jgi:hypothetical protein|nr:NAD(P)/FAD-dependent oxidoreductase [Candidatus Thermoplasmatota archaeon]